MILKGQGAAPGIGIGSVKILTDLPQKDYTRIKVSQQAVAEETARVQAAISQASEQIEDIRLQAEARGESGKVDVMTAHSMMVADPMLKGAIDRGLEALLVAEGAVQSAIAEMAEAFEALDDPYFRERAQDVRDIGDRLLRNLLGIEAFQVAPDAEPFLLMGRDITPSLFAALPTEKLLGIGAELGGKTSHTAILAGNSGIPAVLGCPNLVSTLNSLAPGGILAVDGDKGEIYLELQEAELKQLQTEKARREEIKKALLPLINQPTSTKDGTKLDLFANISGVDGAEAALKVGAEGVGLFRTEFLYMERPDLPSEEEQYQIYRQVLSQMNGKPVIFRTMDIGGDKEAENLGLEKEDNPFLGYRAIRICLEREELFLTQLRALVRAAVDGKALIMFPMIQSVEEFRKAKSLVLKAITELKSEGIACNAEIPVGIMIEIPAAAVISDLLIQEADFFSIGTNDLVQYTLAVDRMNQRIAGLYNHFHPAVLRLIQKAIEAPQNQPEHKFCGMCGEMASDPLATLLLVGLGLKEFSVAPAKLLLIRKFISEIDLSFSKAVAAQALQCTTAQEVENLLRERLPESLKTYL